MPSAALLFRSDLSWSRETAARISLRGYAEVSRFFDGLELEPPGLVRLDEWWAKPDGYGSAASLLGYCGVARKR